MPSQVLLSFGTRSEVSTQRQVKCCCRLELVVKSAHIMPSQVLLSFETRSEVNTHNAKSSVAVVWNS